MKVAMVKKKKKWRDRLKLRGTEKGNCLTTGIGGIGSSMALNLWFELLGLMFPFPELDWLW